jgi:hypothetical protein
MNLLKHCSLMNWSLHVNLFGDIQTRTLLIFIFHRILLSGLSLLRRLPFCLDYLFFLCFAHFVVSLVGVAGTESNFENSLLYQFVLPLLVIAPKPLTRLFITFDILFSFL